MRRAETVKHKGSRIAIREPVLFRSNELGGPEMKRIDRTNQDTNVAANAVGGLSQPGQRAGHFQAINGANGHTIPAPDAPRSIQNRKLRSHRN
jgi:hypothetical protein